MPGAEYAARPRGVAYAETGRPEEALRWLRSGVAQVTGPRSPPYGTWHRDVARVLDVSGRREQAAHHYARFVEAWEHADPEVQPQVRSARERLAELAGERLADFAGEVRG